MAVCGLVGLTVIKWHRHKEIHRHTENLDIGEEEVANASTSEFLMFQNLMKTGTKVSIDTQ